MTYGCNFGVQIKIFWCYHGVMRVIFPVMFRCHSGVILVLLYLSFLVSYRCNMGTALIIFRCHSGVDLVIENTKISEIIVYTWCA